MGCFDPYSDDPSMAVRKVNLCPQSGRLFVGGTAGQVLIFELADDAEDSGADAIVDVNNPEAAANSGSGGQWTVAEVSESPRGEIKMKINRGQSGRSSAAASPVTASASATPVPSPVQRLSRRMVQEIGMSPGKLNKMLLGSPSPSRKRPREEVSELIWFEIKI